MQKPLTMTNLPHHHRFLMVKILNRSFSMLDTISASEMSLSSSMGGNPERLHVAGKSNSIPHYTRFRTINRNSYDRTYYTNMKENTEETRRSVSTRNEVPFQSPNYTVEASSKTILSKWDVEDLLEKSPKRISLLDFQLPASY